MAIRYSGAVKVLVRFVEQACGGDYYHCVVMAPGSGIRSEVVRIGARNLEAGIAFDSSRAYDVIARSATSFACDADHGFEALLDCDRDGETIITRKATTTFEKKQAFHNVL